MDKYMLENLVVLMQSDKVLLNGQGHRLLHTCSVLQPLFFLLKVYLRDLLIAKKIEKVEVNFYLLVFIVVC